LVFTAPGLIAVPQVSAACPAARMLFVEGIGLLTQGPIVDKATRTEGAGKKMLLLVSWGYSVLVGSLLFHNLHDSRYAVKIQQDTQTTSLKGTRLLSPCLKPYHYP
jgi:hypothetical protein